MRFHILGIPHTVSSIEYLSCAFTQKVVKFCAMMKTDNIKFSTVRLSYDNRRASVPLELYNKSKNHHWLIHYGHERSKVDVDEHVTVTNDKILKRAYGDYDWKKEFFKHNTSDYANKKFNENCIRELNKRVMNGDFLLCFWGSGHKEIAEHFKDKCIIVEPGIGYGPESSFAPFKVFESYAVMHNHYGLNKIIHPPWYDCVIGNYWDPNDFKYNDKKKDYILYLGRIIKVKGLDVIIELAKRLNFNLIIAGQGSLKDDIGLKEIPENIECVGFADFEKRKQLLSDAKALILPTYYIEPFGGVTIEAMMSGTPVITTDWGCFSETVLHGVTGFRCRTLDQFEYAINHIEDIKPIDCYEWATKNYSTDRIKLMYNEYFDMLMKVKIGNGFYQDDKNRNNLEWLRKFYPTS